MLRRRFLESLDIPTLVTALVLAFIGILAIASATIDQPGRAGLWRSQLVALGIAFVALCIVVAVDYHVWAQFALEWHGAVILVLGRGARRGERGRRKRELAPDRAGVVPALPSSPR